MKTTDLEQTFVDGQWYDFDIENRSWNSYPDGYSPSEEKERAVKFYIGLQRQEGGNELQVIDKKCFLTRDEAKEHVDSIKLHLSPSYWPCIYSVTVELSDFKRDEEFNLDDLNKETRPSYKATEIWTGQVNKIIEKEGRSNILEQAHKKYSSQVSAQEHKNECKNSLNL